MSKKNKAPVNYPFESKKSIKAKLDADFQYRCDAMVAVLALQTAVEQDKAQTIVRNKAGFMSSHAVKGTAVAKKLIAGDELTPEDVAVVDAVAPHYSRQLAVQAREAAKAADPDLAATAAVFGC